MVQGSWNSVLKLSTRPCTNLGRELRLGKPIGSGNEAPDWGGLKLPREVPTVRLEKFL